MHWGFQQRKTSRTKKHLDPIVVPEIKMISLSRWSYWRDSLGEDTQIKTGTSPLRICLVTVFARSSEYSNRLLCLSNLRGNKTLNIWGLNTIEHLWAPLKSIRSWVAFTVLLQRSQMAYVTAFFPRSAKEQTARGLSRAIAKCSDVIIKLGGEEAKKAKVIFMLICFPRRRVTGLISSATLPWANSKTSLVRFHSLLSVFYLRQWVNFTTGRWSKLEG